MASAQATPVEALDVAPSDVMEMPWMPDIVRAVDAYVPDPSYNGGRLGLDHFAASNAVDIVGGVTAPLANGDFVVAGLVPTSPTTTCNNGAALCRIGLARYTPSGARRAWSNPGAFGSFGNQYVTYPGTSTSATYLYIRDVKVRNGKIYVLVDISTGSSFGSKNVRVIAFNDDGSPIEAGLSGVFGFGAGSDTWDFYGAQIVMVPPNRMFVTATGYNTISPWIAVNSLVVEADGSLSQDPTWGDGYGSAPYQNRQRRYFPPLSYCGNDYCNVIVNSVVRPVGFDIVPNHLYIASNIQIGGNDWDVVVLKFSTVDSNPLYEFGYQGWRRIFFDESGSTLRDTAAGLYVYQNEVWVTASVAQRCHDGIGIVKLNGVDGSPIDAFGGFGRIVFGGQGDAPFCVSGANSDVPFATSATGGRIGVAGLSRRGLLGSQTFVDPMLAVVDAANGTLIDMDSHPVRDASGTRLGDGVLYSVFGGPNPTSPFTVAGNGRIASAGNTLSYLSGKLLPVSADRIFANGFD